MKKFGLLTAACLMIGLLFGTQVMAQHIELGAAKSAQKCANVTDEGFTASFSFSSIDATEISTEKGAFSYITMDGTYPSGNVGDPTLPAVNKLIAIPYGVNNVSVEVKSFSTKIYPLADFGIKTLYPQQMPLRKDQKPEDVPFAYNEKAYNTKGFVEHPLALVKIQGTMRGIQVGALTINPVQYDASTNSIRVYNDIEVVVRYGQYDKSTSYNEFASTFSPYFAGVYNQMFNWRDDVYDEHPDLWQNPVRMLIIANRMFEDCLQPWYEWKTTKGFYLNINYTDEIGSSASAIRAFIQEEYSKDAPTFLMIMGDKNQVAASGTGSETSCVTDLNYSSVDGDQFPDMYHSRFPAETVAQMQAMINKALEYEQYTMPDPSYLNNVLLIAGQDDGWGVTVGRPTIWYATNYYFNQEHGYDQVHEYSHGTYSGCYSWLNQGVGFANYTAHGSNTSWAGPEFTVSDVNNLTNEHKYFLAMGNCCEAADWGINGTSFGEAMVRAENKAAYAYIGSCPSTYWLNDYYFGVGATSRADGTMPSYEETTMGFYDAMWTDDAYNTVTSLMFIGNLASNAAQALGYTLHCSTLYDWQAYHTLGDGSVMPFRVQPTENNVSHLPTLPIGMNFFTVSAEPGSYVAITKEGVLYGTGIIGDSGTADIQIEPITSGGDVTICVTHPRRIPYLSTIPAAAMNGAYVTCTDVQCEQALVSGAYVAPTVSLKNVGTQTADNINVELSTDSEYIDLITSTTTVPSIAPDATYEITNAFDFDVNVNIPDNTRIRFVVTCTSGSEVWESNFNLTFRAPKFAVSNITNTDLAPGSNATITFDITNEGGADASDCIFEVYSSSNDIVLSANTYPVSAITAGETVNIPVDIAVSSSVETGATYEISYLMTSGHYSVAGNYIISVGFVVDDFEADFTMNDWQFSGQSNWTIVDSGAHSGTHCAKSGSIADNQQSDLILTTEILADGEISFFRKVSSENNYDKLYFYIDNQEMANWSGNVSWSQVSYPVAVGTHTFKWSYKKDFSQSSGSDCAWIDDVQFPPTSITLALDPVTNLEATVNESQVALTWTASAGATNYVIRRNGEEIANLSSTSYEDNVEDGIYTYSVIATDGNGHSSSPEYVTVSVGTVGMEESSLESLSIYPNPVNSILFVNCGNAEFSYEMYNGMGQKVANGTANGSAQISVSDMNRGVYFIRLTSGTQVRMEKIVVE